MESSTTEPVKIPQEEQETINSKHSRKADSEGISEECYPLIKDDKSDSDDHSDDFSSNDEQNIAVNRGNSQFYESSDSKDDYAVKVDDNDTLSDIDDIKTDTASADSEDSALGSLPPDTIVPDKEEEPQDRSEGSDSGIGSETLEDVKLPSFNLALPCTTSLKSTNDTESINDSLSQNNRNIGVKCHNVLEQVKILTKSNLKRKLDEKNELEPQTKKRKNEIKFDNVTVYYFPRAQGFSCVPSQGGSTLGMEWEHSHMQKFSLAEHALEQRRLHRQILQQLKSERHSLQGASLSSSEDSDTEEEASDISESELDLDSYYFLQPVPTRQRRALLRAAGVRKIEAYEKNECRDIRTSREFCGCACKGACNPESCSCSLAGIKCQVDRLNFPCGCTRDGCENTTGRIEFNPIRVKTHFIHTLMRVGLERKNEENRDAAKRQWVEGHSTNSTTCSPSTSFDRDNCKINPDDGLLRDVSLSPRVEVESCVNAGNFSNVHFNVGNSIQTTSQDGMSYPYRNESCNRDIHVANMQYDNTNTHQNRANPYTSTIIQGKGPPYVSAGAMGYNTMANNIQQFPCNLNYSYVHANDSHQFKGLQSFSASSFEEFAHSSQMSMFNHYGHMYATDYAHKPGSSMQDHNSLQYHNAPQNHYDMYKSTECAKNELKGDYNTLMTMPYQNSNKVQTVENDENWFSHNTLLNLDHNDQSTQDAAELQNQTTENTESNSSETTENFGELIKKTMVESVTV